MKRGEVWWINFDPSVGGEIKKKRPAVIISNNSANKYLNRIQVIPITSNVDKIYPSEAYITIDKKKAKVMADQLTTVSKQRIIKRIGSLTAKELKKIGNAIKVHLDL